MQTSEQLLAARTPDGHWSGDLSSSALSTATAVTALAVVQRESEISNFKFQIAAGLDWLAKNVNLDGGWGDTVLSRSNLSTTVLCWAAFGAVPGGEEKFVDVVRGAENWIRQHAGGLQPGALVPAISRRYDKDRTFSVPILTMGALAGRLGAGTEGWRWVRALPFELAACPHQWFAALHLPVVSYALPALIAIGQARHHHRPSRNPFARLLRNLTRQRTLNILENIQPSNGGFLEATPLTSFVTMSLAGSSQWNHPVCKKGVEFLLASQRGDGSWPIDTDLATWVTTLSLNALASIPAAQARELGLWTLDFGLTLRNWLLSQQHRVEHSYTHAAPGGWAWTNLPGGVPDADDTAGTLLALPQMRSAECGVRNAEVHDAALAGVKWLLDLQNADGGIPTFCRGWSALPFDRSSADITAHAIRAWAAWMDELSPPLQSRASVAIDRALTFLCRTQRSDGVWIPLWFGNELAPEEENPTYGTARVLTALGRSDRLHLSRGVNEAIAKAAQWLLAAQNADGSWGGFAKAPASVEETALATEALAALLSQPHLSASLPRDAIFSAACSGTHWLIERVESGQWKQPAPIGFYFAKLWYYERLYPLIFTVGALGSMSTCLDSKRQ